MPLNNRTNSILHCSKVFLISLPIGRIITTVIKRRELKNQTILRLSDTKIRVPLALIQAEEHNSTIPNNHSKPPIYVLSSTEKSDLISGCQYKKVWC